MVTLDVLSVKGKDVSTSLVLERRAEIDSVIYTPTILLEPLVMVREEDMMKSSSRPSRCSVG